ncbi:MAG: transporter substrate-binding domain-containing protein [Fretibacterium sp.]|nr:transporter substrate-binding domain-containing protein [Fretibacterium sp.]
MKRIGIPAIAITLALASAFTFFLMREEDPGKLIEPGKVLKVGIECDFAPYNWEEKKASATNQPLANNEGFYVEGYDVQISRIIAERLKAKVKYLKIPWGDMLAALNDGRIDMVVSGMVDTNERKQLAAFSNVYTPSPIEYTIMVRKDSPYAESTTLADFHNARMVGQKGAMMDTLIDQVYGVNHLPPVETVPEMFRDVNRGTADALVINLESIGPYLEEYPNLMAIEFAHGQGFRLGFNGICIAVRKEDTNLLRAINMILFGLSREERTAVMNQMTTKAEKSS